MCLEQLTVKRQEGFAFCSTLMCLSLLLSCRPAFGDSGHAISISVFTSTDELFSVNSVILEGEREVMLVDAQLARASAEKVLRRVKQTKKPLSIIYITHEHADHFLGLEVFKDAYPEVRIIATSAVVDRINKVYQEKLDKWQRLLGPDASVTAVEVSKFDGSSIAFDGSSIQIIRDIQGDTDQNTMLWIPRQRILIGGDVVFDDIHVYTAETDSGARAKWLETLQRIRELKPSVVVPGHSKVETSLDAATAVNFTERYLLAFDEELPKAKDQEDLISAMKERFPSAGLQVALERGAKANLERRQAN
jgi:glyoxylase-like metal-dependent hydrolase (beta-lactamase superfamily II)